MATQSRRALQLPVDKELLDEMAALRAESKQLAGAQSARPPVTREQVDEAAQLRAGKPQVFLDKKTMGDVELGTTSAVEGFTRGARHLAAGAVEGVGDLASAPFSLAETAAELGPFVDEAPGIGQGIRDKFGVAGDFVGGGITVQNRDEKFARYGGEELGAGAAVAWPLRALAVSKSAMGTAGRFMQGIADELPWQFWLGEVVGAGGSAAGRMAFEEAGAWAEMGGAVTGDFVARNVGALPLRIAHGLGKFLGFFPLKSVAKQDEMLVELAEALRTPEGIAKIGSTKAGRLLLAEAAETIQRAAGNQPEIDAAVSLIDDYEQLALDFGARGSEDIVLPSPLANPGLATLMNKSTARAPSLAVRLLAASGRGTAFVRKQLAKVGGLGPKQKNSGLLNTGAVIEGESRRRLDAVAAEVMANLRKQEDAVEQVDDAALETIDPGGSLRLDDNATLARKAEASAAFAEGVEAAWLTAKTDLVEPKYLLVEELAEQFGGVTFSSKHTKDALAKVRRPMREGGKLDAATEVFDLIDAWPSSGVDFARLRDMQKTLNTRIEDLVSAQKFTQAEELRKLKSGVDKDIMEFEIADVVTPARKAAPDHPARGIGPDEGNTVGLGAERTAEGRRIAREGSTEPGEFVLGTKQRQGVDVQADRQGNLRGTGLEGPFEGPTLRESLDGGGFKRPATLEDVDAQSKSLRTALKDTESPEAAAAIRTRLAELSEQRKGIISSERQPGGPTDVGPKPEGTAGTPGGAMRRGEDNTRDLANERTRVIIQDALTAANDAYKKLAAEFYDPIATGSILKAHRVHNPVPHSEQLGLFLKQGEGYAERVGELVARLQDNPAVTELARDWLIADAYQHAVRNVEMPDGSTRPRLDRKKLDDWKRANATAINGVEGTKGVVDDARALVEQARRLGAVPPPTPRAANVQALNKFVADPQRFWDSIPGMGIEEGRKAVRDIIGTIRKSGDDDALQGLRESFISSNLMRKFTESQGNVSPQQSLEAMNDILDSPALKETMTALFGAEHVRLVEMAARVQKNALDVGEIPSSVQAKDLSTPTEQFAEAATKGSLYNVIMGPIRRTAKTSAMMQRFLRDLTELKAQAIIDEAWQNPALLRDLMTRDPSAKLVKGIRTRMGTNHPTLFPRVERDQEEIEERREKSRKDETANRAFVSPPRNSLLSPPVNGSGSFV
jgi:hypothetical protein